MTFGWCGKILRVNLTDGTFSAEPLAVHEVKDAIGARGFAMYLYGKQVASAVDPRSPENTLVFATSPLTGTLSPNGGHYSVVTQAVMDGGLSCANLGGAWGPQLKYAGFDALVIHGKSKSPVYLWIDDGVVELRNAGAVWGKNVKTTVDQLLAETDKKARVCCIGPAGEVQLDAAALVGDTTFAAGVPGVAAVAGDKNLKAIVVRGTKGVRLARAAEFMNAAQTLRDRFASMLIRGTGSKLHGSLLKVTSVAEDAEAIPSDGLRPRDCFGCAAALSSFTEAHTGETIARFGKDHLPEMDAVRLKEQRAFVDLGLDYLQAKAMLADMEQEGERDEVALADRLARGELGCRFDADISAESGYSSCVVGGFTLQPAITTIGLGKDSGVDASMFAAAESAGFCPLAAALVNASEVATLLSSATGVNYSPEDVLRAGRRLATATGK